MSPPNSELIDLLDTSEAEIFHLFRFTLVLRQLNWFVVGYFFVRHVAEKISFRGLDLTRYLCCADRSFFH